MDTINAILRAMMATGISDWFIASGIALCFAVPAALLATWLLLRAFPHLRQQPPASDRDA